MHHSSSSGGAPLQPRDELSIRYLEYAFIRQKELEAADAVVGGPERGKCFAGILTYGTDDPDACNKDPACHALFLLVLEDIIGHCTDRGENLPAFLGILDLDAVIFFEKNDQLQCIN